MVSVLTHTPTAILRYLLDGEDGLERAADRLHRAAHDRPDGKFDKREALYLPQTPFPPALWHMQCERCRFYADGEPGQPAMCHLVGREGDRWGGEAIHPRGWCAYFLPPEGEPPFEWVRERLNPTGADTIRGEYHRPLGERGVDTTPEREREVPVTTERPVEAGGERPVEDGGERPVEDGGTSVDPTTHDDPDHDDPEVDDDGA